MTWDRSADVVVVGAGVAGLSAAIAARHFGLDTIILEKHSSVGGSSSYSWGFLWVAPNHLALSDGEIDSDEEINSYMNFLAGGQADADRMTAFVKESPAALKFFEERGVELKLARGLTDHYFGIAPGSRASGRSVEVKLISGQKLGKWKDKVLRPPAEYRVTGEEMIAWGGMNNAVNWPADEMALRHRTDQRGLGVGLISQLLHVLLNLGTEPEVNSAAKRLIVSDGRVVGLETADGEMIEARRGVVISTGGYESNPNLVQELEAIPGFVSMFPPHITGDGLTMGQEVGGAIRSLRANMSMFLGYNVPTEDGSFFRLAGIIETCSPHTMVVNRFGQRFTDESYFQYIVPSIVRFDPVIHSYTNLPCFLIFDQQYVERFSVAGRAPGLPVPDWVVRGDNLAELANRLDIDPTGLNVTVERFNEFVRSGVDHDFHRGELPWTLAKETGESGNRSLGSVERGPFYGIELHPSSISSAGLATDEAARVLHVRRRPIPGLYATGNAAAHTEYGAGYQAGHSLMSGMTFSLLAVKDMLSQRA